MRAIRVCAPIQARLPSRPVIICRATRAGNQGLNGYKGTRAVETRVNTNIIRRVPSRSMSTPPWIARRNGRNDRAPIMMPIWAGVAPRVSAQRGTITVMKSALILAARPVPNTG